MRLAISALAVVVLMLALSVSATPGYLQFVFLPARLLDQMVGILIIPCKDPLLPHLWHRTLVLDWTEPMTQLETVHSKTSKVLVDPLVFLKEDLGLPELPKETGPRHLELTKDPLGLVLHKGDRGLLEHLKVIGPQLLERTNKDQLDRLADSNQAISLGQRLLKHKQEVSRELQECVGCQRQQVHGRGDGPRL